MTPMNRRQMALSLLAGSLTTGLISGCATKADDSTIMLFQRPPNPTVKEIAERERAKYFLQPTQHSK